MEYTKSRRGRKTRKFPVKLVNFHIPLQLLEQVEKFTASSGMRKTAFYQAATCLFLESFGLPKPEAVELDLEEIKDQNLCFDSSGEPCERGDLL